MKEVRDFTVGFHLQSFSAKACEITADIRKEMWLNTVVEVKRVVVLCCLLGVRIRFRKSCSGQREFR